MGETRPSITERERDVLDFVQLWGITRGFSPTVREIGRGLGLSSTSTVWNHLARLTRKGYLVSEAGQSRTLRLVDDQFQAIKRGLA